MRKWDFLILAIFEVIFLVGTFIVFRTPYYEGCKYNLVQESIEVGSEYYSFDNQNYGSVKRVNAKRVVLNNPEIVTEDLYYLHDDYLYNKDTGEIVGVFADHKTFYKMEGDGAIYISEDIPLIHKIAIGGTILFASLIIGGVVYNIYKKKKYNSLRKGSN